MPPGGLTSKVAVREDHVACRSEGLQAHGTAQSGGGADYKCRGKRGTGSG